MARALLLCLLWLCPVLAIAQTSDHPLGPGTPDPAWTEKVEKTPSENEGMVNLIGWLVAMAVVTIGLLLMSKLGDFVSKLRR